MAKAVPRGINPELTLFSYIVFAFVGLLILIRAFRIKSPFPVYNEVVKNRQDTPSVTPEAYRGDRLAVTELFQVSGIRRGHKVPTVVVSIVNKKLRRIV